MLVVNYDKYSWADNKGKDLEKLHKKTYKQCMKYAEETYGQRMLFVCS